MDDSGSTDDPGRDDPPAPPRSTRFDRLVRSTYVKGLPEWEYFERDDDRLRAIESIERGMMPRDLKSTLQFLLAVAVLMLVPWLVTSAVVDWLLPNAARRGFITLVVTLLIYMVLVTLLIRRDIPKDLREHLIRAGVPICLRCGYVLRGLPPETTVCPECGRSVDPRVPELLRAPTSPGSTPDSTPESEPGSTPDAAPGPRTDPEDD